MYLNASPMPIRPRANVVRRVPVARGYAGSRRMPSAVLQRARPGELRGVPDALMAIGLMRDLFGW